MALAASAMITAVLVVILLLVDCRGKRELIWRRRMVPGVELEEPQKAVEFRVMEISTASGGESIDYDDDDEEKN